MDEVAVAIITGMVPLIFLAIIPTAAQLFSLFLIVCLLFVSERKLFRLIAITLLSFCWAAYQGQIQLQQISSLQGVKREVITEVQTVNLGTEGASVFFKIEREDGKRVFPPVLFRAKWEGGRVTLLAGQRWKMLVSLRPVHSLLNEGGFDAQRWALSQHAPLTGTIYSGEPLDTEAGWRQQFIQRVMQKMPELTNAPVLIALAFGEKGLIQKPEMLVLQRTGIAHLVAISGLHIGIAALFGGWLARMCQWFMPVRLIDYRFPLVVSEIFLLIYTWLAGCNAPALRTAIAFSLWILLRYFRVRCHPWQVWLWGVALLLITDPMNLLSDSFWLSCFAVASLVFWYQWMPLPAKFQKHWYWCVIRWGHLQAGVTLLLLPLQTGIFHGINVASFLANMWAVPVVSLLTVPCILVVLLLNVFPAGLLTEVQTLLWQGADYTLSLAMWGVRPFTGSWFALGENCLFISLLGWLAIIFCRIGHVKQWLSILVSFCTLSVVWYARIPAERWRVDMLDVGHGLSVLISRNGKGILYDTGNKWEGGSAAEQNILPFLNWRNIELEQIIISHNDMDHRGGLPLLQSRYPQASLRESSMSEGHLACVAGEHWQWHGLKFNVLWPEAKVADARNDDSCVIRIDDGSFSLLLTGDIEASTEKALIRKWRGELHSTVLQVPHHGSNTSSSPPFLRAVSPESALASAARFNKWHLPAHKVVSRYNKARYDWHSTSDSGQLSLFIYGDYWAIKGLREQLNPRWYHRRFGVSVDNE
ncbi:DNA internalization-related competence protein ComEC/Rec2 [Rahnella sp. PD12R]|uniref:DNA internalization-related competence protein ComEC/Rec2 n=1 Tax=Rahnella sp. PD12R TaxID=2855688 RepID=UPI00210721A2|nr:DNA internalization-related competence protein ComEC/Rec2 [Rahnella sp. PD12R]